jgi:Tfp pilus assembly protein PilX
MKRQPCTSRKRQGAVLAVALVTLLVVTILAGTVLRSYLQAHRQLRREQEQLQAQWLAEGAIARAIAQLGRDPDYSGETWTTQLVSAEEHRPAEERRASASALIEIAPDPTNPQRLQISAIVRIPDVESPRAQATRTFHVPKPTGN